MDIAITGPSLRAPGRAGRTSRGQVRDSAARLRAGGMLGQARRVEQFANRVRLNLDYRQAAVAADGGLHRYLARAVFSCCIRSSRVVKGVTFPG